MLTFADFGFDSLLIPLLVAGGCMLLLRCVAALCARVTAQRDATSIALSLRDAASSRAVDAPSHSSAQSPENSAQK